MKRFLLALLACLFLSLPVVAANVALINTPVEPSLMQAVLNQTILSINSGITPNSMAPYGNFRNFLDNGNFAVNQRGTTATAGASTSAVISANYASDRWVVDTNVTSGAGYGAIVTTGPTPMPGSINSLNVYRNSGALTQPVCLHQIIPTNDVVQLQGQPVVLSAYMQALAGFTAASKTVTAYLITGTGTDEGFATWTASTAITPAFTGVATVTLGTATLTGSWARSSWTTIMPATATEADVAICFTPVGSGSGATDGFSISQAQFEQGSVASSFEFRPYQVELAKAQRYYWQFLEAANSYAAVPGVCAAQSTTVAVCVIPLKVTMRAAPTVTCTYGTFKRQVAGTATATTACAAAATTNTVSGPDSVAITATVGAGDTAGLSGVLGGGNSTGGGKITASADF